MSSFKQWKLRENDPIYRMGVKSLSNRDLVAHIIQDIPMAENLLGEYETLEELAKLSITELRKVLANESKADALYAAFELSRRYGQSFKEIPLLSCPADVARIMIPKMRGLEQEHLFVLMLNTRGYVKKIECVFVGSLNASIMHPREIFKVAIRESACTIVISHNHPSGNELPSQEDIAATKNIVTAGELLQIQVSDHVIIGDGCYYSMKENGLI